MKNIEVQTLPLGKTRGLYYSLEKGKYKKDYIIIINSQLSKFKQKLILARELLLHCLGAEKDMV